MSLCHPWLDFLHDENMSITGDFRGVSHQFYLSLGLSHFSFVNHIVEISSVNLIIAKPIEFGTNRSFARVAILAFSLDKDLSRALLFYEILKIRIVVNRVKLIVLSVLL
jgi:hypothetical protein